MQIELTLTDTFQQASTLINAQLLVLGLPRPPTTRHTMEMKLNAVDDIFWTKDIIMSPTGIPLLAGQIETFNQGSDIGLVSMFSIFLRGAVSNNKVIIDM